MTKADFFHSVIQDEITKNKKDKRKEAENKTRYNKQVSAARLLLTSRLSN